MISSHTIHYNINRTGDPTWSGNYILQGAHRTWAKVKNTHANAASIMKFTGKVAAINLNFNLGAGTNGLIMTHGGCRVYSCQFVGEDLEAAKTALWLDHTTGGKHIKVIDNDFLGHTSYMTALKIDQFGRSNFERLRIHECKTGIQIVGANSDSNIFNLVDIGECGLALDLDAGNEQHFYEMILHHNTVNVDDEVQDHIWVNIYGAFSISIYPDNFTGITVTAHNNADTWGADTEVRAAVVATKPFRIVAVHFEPAISQWYRVQFSADSGVSHYDDLMFDATKREGAAFPSGTEFIFNPGTRISARAKAESGGEDTVQVWIEVQEI